MGRTIPSWRIVVDEELERLARFRQFVRPEDCAVFDDLVAQCRVYASSAGVLASPSNGQNEESDYRHCYRIYCPSRYVRDTYA
jgi:hypothetical protein